MSSRPKLPSEDRGHERIRRRGQKRKRFGVEVRAIFLDRRARTKSKAFWPIKLSADYLQ
jgi:hypothetical protein